MNILSIFKRKPKVPAILTAPGPNAVLYRTGGFWGDKISWHDRDGEHLRRVVGWKSPRPSPGDVLTCEMQSGRTGVWIFQEVDYCNNPHDMFFADVNAVGYTDEIMFSLPKPPRTFDQIMATG